MYGWRLMHFSGGVPGSHNLERQSGEEKRPLVPWMSMRDLFRHLVLHLSSKTHSTFAPNMCR